MTGRPRLAKLDVAGLSDGQRALYESITAGPRAQGPQRFVLTDGAGRLEGPFNAMLLSPPLGSALQALGSAVRYGSAFTDRAREIAILVVAHHWLCEFEIYAHKAVGRGVGLTGDQLVALGEGRPGALDNPDERLVATTALALVVRADLTDEEYAAAAEGLGPELLFELTTLVGYYATLALQLRIHRVPAPE